MSLGLKNIVARSTGTSLCCTTALLVRDAVGVRHRQQSPHLAVLHALDPG